jgi:hypothetical protein
MGHGRAEKKHLWREDMMMMYMGNVPQFHPLKLMLRSNEKVAMGDGGLPYLLMFGTTLVP